ncbi:MAG: hypothetical protein KDI83_09365 [Gammaproteobacteria bacterium]|nr:hypothetical protein [Gammaproteobacteria bacterium]
MGDFLSEVKQRQIAAGFGWHLHLNREKKKMMEGGFVRTKVFSSIQRLNGFGEKSIDRGGEAALSNKAFERTGTSLGVAF